MNLGIYLMAYGGEPQAVFRDKFLMPVYLAYSDDHQDDWMDDYIASFEDMFQWKENSGDQCIEKFCDQFRGDWCDPERSEGLRKLQGNIMACEEEIADLD